MKPKAKSQISRITIGRLYNLGSYEHVRYELSADVPEGASPLAAWRGIMKILRGANPKAPVSMSQYKLDLDFLKDPEAWGKNITDVAERKRTLATRKKDARARVREFEAWQKARQSALKRLDDLGGAVVHKDAKDDWRDDDWD